MSQITYSIWDLLRKAAPPAMLRIVPAADAAGNDMLSCLPGANPVKHL